MEVYWPTVPLESTVVVIHGSDLPSAFPRRLSSAACSFRRLLWLSSCVCWVAMVVSRVPILSQISWSDFIVGAGAPLGVSEPWAKALAVMARERNVVFRMRSFMVD